MLLRLCDVTDQGWRLGQGKCVREEVDGNRDAIAYKLWNNWWMSSDFFYPLYHHFLANKPFAIIHS